MFNSTTLSKLKEMQSCTAKMMVEKDMQTAAEVGSEMWLSAEEVNSWYDILMGTLVAIEAVSLGEIRDC